MESNFQSVKGKKKKGTFQDIENSEGLRGKKREDRWSKVPFHVPSIPRPQEEYNIRVNNSNMPFEHVWLEKSEDGSQFVHPMEKLSVLDFVDGHVRESGPLNLHLESIPFKLVEGVKELKELATKLKDVNEFAVDLEHNQYRSFQGLTCLMQISTRTEDFAIDTLKLYVHVGPYLREVFKDPSKRKVMHGADCDILWLQRDFGIYVCNLFDTGQASRVLQLERNSLGYLLHHFCGIDINKEYQNADWRVRPLPHVMLRYAREDTHYLLHLYDLMKSRLLSAPSSDANKDTLLMEVCKRSNEICMHLCEKELLTNESFLHIYGLREANFNAQQLSIVSGLNEWRDSVARREDESTGYVLPNKALLEIARKMPLSPSKLQHLVKSKYPYVDHNHQTIIRIIRDSIQNASAFEKHAEALKNYLQEKYEQQIEAVGYSSVPLFHVQEREGSKVLPLPEIGCFFKPPDTPEKNNAKIGNGSIRVSKSEKPDIAFSVKILKKPTSELEETLENPTSDKKFYDNVQPAHAQDKADIKIQQYKSSTTPPSHSFSGARRFLEPNAIEEQETASSRNKIEKSQCLEKSRCSTQTPIPDSNMKLREQLPFHTEDKKSDTQRGRDPLSLTNMSSTLEECFQVKQFNGLASREQIKPEEPQEDLTVGASELLTPRVLGGACNCKGSFVGPSPGKERIGKFHQSWWQQAFPPPCNRGMGNL